MMWADNILEFYKLLFGTLRLILIVMILILKLKTDGDADAFRLNYSGCPPVPHMLYRCMMSTVVVRLSPVLTV